MRLAAFALCRVACMAHTPAFVAPMWPLQSTARAFVGGIGRSSLKQVLNRKTGVQVEPVVHPSARALLLTTLCPSLWGVVFALPACLKVIRRVPVPQREHEAACNSGCRGRIGRRVGFRRYAITMLSASSQKVASAETSFPSHLPDPCMRGRVGRRQAHVPLRRLHRRHRLLPGPGSRAHGLACTRCDDNHRLDPNESEPQAINHLPHVPTPYPFPRTLIFQPSTLNT